MNGLLYLTSDDFSIQKGSKSNLMCHNIRGFSLILFYSTNCVYCQELIPIFKTLPGTIGGCQFGMLNVSTNRNCVLMSQNTIAPLKYVPCIMLYVNGRPHMIYKGGHNTDMIRNFVIEVANNLQKRTDFTVNRDRDDHKSNQKKPNIPDYTVGIPVYGNNKDNVCYLEFMEAYSK